MPSVRISGENDLVLARQAGRALARALGFSTIDQARVTTAISELVRNILLYAGQGDVSLKEIENGAGRKGLEIRFDDEGPGIRDLDQAMAQGYSSSKGLGAGLPGTRRLVDEFEIRSSPGGGTHVTVRKWR